jgi:monothiol glutaredoxin
MHLKPLLATTALSRTSSHQNQVGAGRRTFSDDSHDDFAPKRKTVGDIDDAVKMIDEHVKSNRIMLYMKGNPSMPMCGFSAKVVQILQTEGVDFASVNVLDYPTIREGIKKYSDWPTIPQLYVNAEFVGGCDIITSMHESGELKELLVKTNE